jgi:hypothetical protein
MNEEEMQIYKQRRKEKLKKRSGLIVSKKIKEEIQKYEMTLGHFSLIEVRDEIDTMLHKL